MPALVRARVLALAQAPLRALVEMAAALRTKRTELVAKPSHSSVCGGAATVFGSTTCGMPKSGTSRMEKHCILALH